ncbi:MAG: hypothetical protein ABSA77_02210 [Thermoguttaceae bacterium]
MKTAYAVAVIFCRVRETHHNLYCMVRFTHPTDCGQGDAESKKSQPRRVPTTLQVVNGYDGPSPLNET